MTPEQEIEQLRMMLARAFLVLDELDSHGTIVTPGLLSYAWVECREWLSDREIAAARAFFDCREKKRAKTFDPLAHQ